MGLDIIYCPMSVKSLNRSTASFTKDSKIVSHRRGTSWNEYKNKANNSNMHAIYIEINSYEDYLLIRGYSDSSSERRHYQAVLKSPEEYNWDPKFKRNTYYYLSAHPS